MLLKLLITTILIAITMLWWKRRNNPAGQVPNGAELSLEQAYAILGLSAACQRDDIIQSHRRLMSGVHPDRGGSNFLAAQLNAAKQRLLQAHPN